MDYLLLAKALMEEIKDPTIDKVGQAQLTQAAALIARAERHRPQVVQVGSYAIRADCIATVYEHGDGPTISVYSTTGASLAMLEGEERAAFLAWWNEYADVVQLEVGG